MKCKSKFALLVGAIAAVAALVASITAVALYFDKKRDEEDLEHYLDCSIQ